MSTKNLEKNLFNLKFAAKQLERNAKKSEKDEKTEKGKLKKAIQKNNLEGARIHAENSIRNKNQALNYRRLSSRIDAVASRVQTAITMKQVTKAMAGVVHGMDSALKSMNLEKIVNVMDQFERQFEHLDVQTQTMDEAMQGAVTLNIPENQVQGLMQETADEAGLELNLELPSAAITNTVTEGDAELTAKLAKLRANDGGD